jgi:hypothetical protein
VTDDVPKATAFYKGLFGWRFDSWGGYLLAMNNDRQIAGVFQRPRPADPKAKPRWFGYISVPSVAKAERVVVQEGGPHHRPASEVSRSWRAMSVGGQRGALFGVIRSADGDPGDFGRDVGDWIWIQLWSRDARKATEFYREVAGYTLHENTTNERSHDYILVASEYARGTMLTLPESSTVHPTWLAFVL